MFQMLGPTPGPVLSQVTRGVGGWEFSSTHPQFTHTGGEAEPEPQRSRSPRRKRPAEPSTGLEKASTGYSWKPEPAEKSKELHPKSKPRDPRETREKRHPKGPMAIEEGEPKRFAGERYGSWTHDPKNLGNRPRCLHLFSGPQRPNGLAEELAKLGWAVCSVDKEQPISTDLLDNVVREAIMEDVEAGDHIMLGTPCETYSRLRKEPPGPRPLVWLNARRSSSRKGMSTLHSQAWSWSSLREWAPHSPWKTLSRSMRSASGWCQTSRRSRIWMGWKTWISINVGTDAKQQSLPGWCSTRLTTQGLSTWGATTRI